MVDLFVGCGYGDGWLVYCLAGWIIDLLDGWLVRCGWLDGWMVMVGWYCGWVGLARWITLFMIEEIHLTFVWF